MSFDRAALVAHARASIARGSKSFAAASQLFAPATRERVWLLYGWCRACDDLTDGQDHGGVLTPTADAPARLARLRALTDCAYAGQSSGDPAFDGLGQLLREVALPRTLADDVIAGFALDAADWRPQTEADLYQYCYHVAGAVGCMMAVVMGVAADDAPVLDRACDLGLAFQLANIARDVAEDAAAGRHYLPADWLEAAGIPPGAMMDASHRPALAALTGRVAALAADYEASARVGAAALPRRSRWAVLAAAGIYGDIARAVAADPARALGARTVTSAPAKWAWVARSGWQALRPPAPMPRGGLWTRPQ